MRQWITQKSPIIGKKANSTLRMAKRFARRGKYMEAGLLFESIQRFGDAASLYLKAGAFSKAGEIFLKEKETLRMLLRVLKKEGSMKGRLQFIITFRTIPGQRKAFKRPAFSKWQAR
jgi:HEPN domain-containing protein